MSSTNIPVTFDAEMGVAGDEFRPIVVVAPDGRAMTRPVLRLAAAGWEPTFCPDSVDA